MQAALINCTIRRRSSSRALMPTLKLSFQRKNGPEAAFSSIEGVLGEPAAMLQHRCYDTEATGGERPFAVCREIGTGEDDSKRFGGFAGLLPLRQHAMPSSLGCPDCAFWVGEG